MTTKKDRKIIKLYKLLEPGKLVTASLLEQMDISRNLIKYYLESGWLESFGRGVYKKPGDEIEWSQAIRTIQEQTDIKVHVGGLTAVFLHGFGHFLRLSMNKIYLFSPQGEKLPKWYTNHNWPGQIIHKQSNFLPNQIGIKSKDEILSSALTSLPERAILECLFMAPQNIDLVECYHLLEGLVNLKPKLLNELLLDCQSVKVKRLFLYMAEKINHQWFQFLELDKIDIGSGHRILAENGVYQAKYLLSIPKELAEL